MLEFAYQTDRGNVRKINEDCGGIFKNKNGLYLGIIADGIGGNRGGDVASAMVTNHLGYLFEESSFTEIEDAYDWLQASLQLENDLLIEKGQRYIDLKEMGTTFVCILISECSCIIANIGDSRGYRFRNGKLLQITQDHSLVNELVKSGAITKEEAKNHPQKNVIIKTLGINKDAQMDRHTLRIQRDDIFLLCSDGLSKLISDDEIIKILNNKKSSLDEKCNKLIEKAKNNGGTDNITVILASEEGGDSQ